MSRYPQFKSAAEEFLAAVRSRKDSAAIEAALERMMEAQESEMGGGVSDAEGVYLQMLAATGCIENHLLRGDRFSAAMQLMRLTGEYDDICRYSSLSPDEIRRIRELILRTCRLVKGEKPPESKKESVPTRREAVIGPCALCGEKEATCTGSHLAPHFLIQTFLSYNGGNSRDTEVINETAMAGWRKERKWGRAVPEDAIDETFGYIPDAEKEVVKPSAVTRDYLLCPACEKRFGLLETAYAESFRKHQPCPNGLMAYLFWLGVFWRLSVGKMALRLNKKDERQIGEMLHRTMPYDADGLKRLSPAEDMGPYSYQVFHCANTKGELSGVIGMHSGQSPYRLLLGDYLVVLYARPSEVKKGAQTNRLDRPEQWQEIPFLTYWKRKQQILDSTTAYESRRLGVEEEKILDVVKGDHLKEPPPFVDGDAQEASYDDIKGHTYYQFKIPGSLQKVMTLIQQHPELDTPEKRFQLIEKELGYTQLEVQEMAQYWSAHVRILKLNGKPKRRKKKKR